MGKARTGGPHLLQGARQVITAIFRLDAGQASEGVCEICKMTDQSQKAKTSRGDNSTDKGLEDYVTQQLLLCCTSRLQC